MIDEPTIAGIPVRDLLEFYSVLSEGEWYDPKSDDVHTSRVNRHSAAFENPVMLASMVSERVRRCGQDGMIVERVYGMDSHKWGIEGVENIYCIDRSYIEKKINDVSWYCDDYNWKLGLQYREWRRRHHDYPMLRNRKISQAV